MLRDFTKYPASESHFITGQVGGGASTSQIQVHNPAASGKVLYIRKLGFLMGAADTITFRRFSSIAAWTLESEGIDLNDITASNTVARIYKRNDNVAEGTALATLLSAANRITTEYDFGLTPMQIVAGQGVGWNCSTVGSTFSIYAIYNER